MSDFTVCWDMAVIWGFLRCSFISCSCLRGIYICSVSWEAPKGRHGLSLKILSSIPVALPNIIRMIMILLKKYRDSPSLLQDVFLILNIYVIALYQIVTEILNEVFGSVSPPSPHFWFRRS